MTNLHVILGNHLFDYKFYRGMETQFFLCEDFDLCTHFKYHKHKIAHFLLSMRHFKDLLENKDQCVHYFKLEDRTTFFHYLEQTIKKQNISKISVFEIEDKFFEQAFFKFCHERQLDIQVIPNPMFMVSRPDFLTYLDSVKKPFMKSFYEQQRKRFNVLMVDGKPIGGKFSFDADNRKKVPKKHELHNFEPPKVESKYLKEISDLIDKYFSNHPGEMDNYWLPTNRKDAIQFFKDYLRLRFIHFGDYQDAIDTRNAFLYHSLIAPMMNIGFFTPDEVIREVEACLKDDLSNLNSIEGFIRQVLGWREFVRGVYHEYDDFQQKENFFNHQRKLTSHWYDGTTGIPVVDDVILKSDKWGYAHHIERLMIMANIFNLLEVHPQEVYKWFMEIFVDSSDWVMGPNVFGMGLFSDGGVFATKPYICGSNYWRKMSHYKAGEWCDIVDGLYWSFIERNSEFFKTNHRLNMMVSLSKKMDTDKKNRLYKAAEDFKKKVTKI